MDYALSLKFRYYYLINDLFYLKNLKNIKREMLLNIIRTNIQETASHTERNPRSTTAIFVQTLRTRLEMAVTNWGMTSFY